MDAVKRKVISELFFAPSVVLPIVVGISAGLVSWAAGGINSLSLLAMGGILGGLGWMATRVIFHVEQITEEALKLQLQRQIDAENSQLDALMRELAAQGDARTQDQLTLLRSLREDFWSVCNRPGVQQRSSDLRVKVSDIFDGVVTSLRETLRMRQLALQLKGDARGKIEKQREEATFEIDRTLDQLRRALDEFRELTLGESRTDLTSLREELDRKSVV